MSEIKLKEYSFKKGLKKAFLAAATAACSGILAIVEAIPIEESFDYGKLVPILTLSFMIGIARFMQNMFKCKKNGL